MLFFQVPNERRRFNFDPENVSSIQSRLGGGVTRVFHDFLKGHPELDAQAYRALLMIAIDDGDVFEIERLLLGQPSFPKIFDFFDASGETPLTLSAERGDARTLRLLLDGGADPEHPNADGVVPMLQCALFFKDQESLDSISALIEAGANPCLAPKGALAPLAWLSQHDEPHRRKAASMLMDAHKAREDWAPYANQALCAAARRQMLPNMAWLMESGADPDGKDPLGTTPMEAAKEIFRSGSIAAMEKHLLAKAHPIGSEIPLPRKNTL